MSKDLEIDPYLILRLISNEKISEYKSGNFRISEEISAEKIKKQYHKLALKFRPEKTRVEYDKNRWLDMDLSYRLLSDENRRRVYDRYRKRRNGDERFSCPNNCLLPDGKNLRKISHREGVLSNTSKRFFCSAPCAKKWNKEKGYVKKTHGWEEDGTRTSSGIQEPPKPELPKKTCPGCKQKKPFSMAKWIKYDELNDNDDYCCTEYCLFDYLKKEYLEGKINKEPISCFRCGRVNKRYESTRWFRSKKSGNYFCSQTHLNETGGIGLGNPDVEETGSNIDEIRTNIIAFIRRKLAEKPEILVSELNDPNYETRINWETEVNLIEQIRDEILSDIVVKRKNKIQQGGLNTLILQAQEAKNDNAVTKLGRLLVEIKSKYQNTGIYQSQLSVIRGLEQYYSTHDQKSEVQRNIVAFLTAILQQIPPINVDELDEQNRNFSQDIQNAATLQKSQEAEARVQDNINEKRTGKAVNNLLIRAQQADKENKEEITSLRQEIMSLRKSNNKWEKIFWNKNESNFEVILLEWSGGGKKNDQNSDSGLFEKYWPVGLTVLVVSGVVFVIWRFDIIRRLKQRKRIKK